MIIDNENVYTTVYKYYKIGKLFAISLVYLDAIIKYISIIMYGL